MRACVRAGMKEKKVKEGQKCPHKQEKALPSNPRTQRQNNNDVGVEMFYN